MAEYKNVLVALDLSDESHQVLEKAKAITKGGDLSLVHVIEPLAYAYGGDIPMDLTEIQQQLQEQAAVQLKKMGEASNVPPARQHVLVGQPTSEIHRLAQESSTDLIVVGSHGRRGIALLLGSTANGVLHGAQCDVLAVRVALTVDQ